MTKKEIEKIKIMWKKNEEMSETELRDLLKQLPGMNEEKIESLVEEYFAKDGDGGENEEELI